MQLPKTSIYYIFLCQVQMKRILLKFSADFHAKFQGEDYDVEFAHNRYGQINNLKDNLYAQYME